MTPPIIPTNTARCNGVFSIEDGVADWREGCETCLRRTATRKGRKISMIEPPAVIAFECEFLIEPKP